MKLVCNIIQSLNRIASALGGPLLAWGFWAMLCSLFVGFVGWLAQVEMNDPEFDNILATIAAGSWGLFRGVGYHPSRSRGKMRWLLASPWTGKNPPPLFPVNLTWRDGAYLLLMMWFAHQGVRWTWQTVLLSFLTAYLLVQMVGLLAMSQYFSSLGGSTKDFAKFMGVAGRADKSLFTLFGRRSDILIIALFYVWVAMLLWTPWGLNWQAAVILIILVLMSLANRLMMTELCWDHLLPADPPPFVMAPQEIETLAGKERYPSVSYVAAAITGGWFAYIVFAGLRLIAVLQPKPDVAKHVMLLIFFCISGMAIVARLSIYMGKTRQIAGIYLRLATGKYLIPRYDKALIVPAMGCFVVAAAGRWFIKHGTVPWQIGAVFGLMIFYLMAAGPTLQKWRLTGQYSMTLGTVAIENTMRRQRQTIPGGRPTPPSIFVPGVRRLASQSPFAIRWIINRALWMMIFSIAAILFFWLGAFSHLSSADNFWLLPLMFSVLITLGILLLTASERVRQFHPAFKPDYLNWLRSTPWQPGKSLPLGPVHPVWQDALIVVAMETIPLGIMIANPHFLFRFGPLILTVIALGVTWFYLASVASVLTKTGVVDMAIYLGYIFGAAVLFAPNLLLVSSMTVFALFAASAGLKRSLNGYPWDDLSPGNVGIRLAWRQGQKPSDVSLIHRVENSIAWMAGKGIPEPMPRKTAILMVLLSGWWVFVGAHKYYQYALGERNLVGGSLLLGLALCLLSVVRTLVYLPGCREPTNIFGRLRTLKIIIPGFDKVLVPSLIAAAFWLATPGLLSVVNLHGDIVLPLGIMAGFASLLLLPPSRRNWILVGQYNLELRKQ